MLCAVASRSLSRDCILFLFYCKFTNLFDCDSKRNCQAQKNKDCHEQRTHHNHFLLFGAVWFAGIDPSKMKTLLFFVAGAVWDLPAFCSMKFRVKYSPCFITWYILSSATRTCKKVKMLQKGFQNFCVFGTNKT